jgi:hypothetical protein
MLLAPKTLAIQSAPTGPEVGPAPAIMVAAVPRDLGVGWATIMRAVRDHGCLLVDNPTRLDGVERLGLDKSSCRGLASESPSDRRPTVAAVGRERRAGGLLRRGPAPELGRFALATSAHKRPPRPTP